MGQVIVKIFPLCAVLVSVLAMVYPALLNWGGFLIIPLLGVIMLGMGSTLSVQDFLLAVKKPKAVAIGMVLQFGLMPLLAYAVGRMLGLPAEQFIGLVMVGSVAGGTASNVIAYLAGGDVALSITMTACSTLAGIVLTPLLSSVYLRHAVAVPAWAMFQSILLVVALPVTLGVLINQFCRKKYASLINNLAPVISAIGIVLVIGIVVSLNREAVFSSGALVLGAVALHNALGMGAGYLLARLCRLDYRTAITIAIEVGMQNSGLAAALSKQFFSVSAALPGTVFSVWHNISGAVFAAAVKRFQQKRGTSGGQHER